MEICKEQKQDRSKSRVPWGRRGLYFSPALPLPAAWPWSNHFTFLDPCFHSCKMKRDGLRWALWPPIRHLSLKMLSSPLHCVWTSWPYLTGYSRLDQSDHLTEAGWVLFLLSKLWAESQSGYWEPSHINSKRKFLKSYSCKPRVALLLPLPDIKLFNLSLVLLELSSLYT